MTRLMLQHYRIINIDESWLNSGNFHRRMWAPATSPATATAKVISPRLSLIAALDSDGRCFFTLTHAITDSNVMLLFISNLCRQLDREIGDWRPNTVFLLDGAKYHTSRESQEFLQKLGVQVIFSGPYSYCKCHLFL